LDEADASHVNSDEANMLFGNGRLDRWLSERRACHKQPRLDTLDGWLSPSKTVQSSPKRSPSAARTGSTSPRKSPLRQKTNANLESLDLRRSPSVDIRKYFRSHLVPPSPTENEFKSDSSAENHLGTVTVVDLVDDGPPRTVSEYSSEAGDGVIPSLSESEAPASSATVQSPLRRRRTSNSRRTTSESEHTSDWWTTSRTKSSMRKGPFKRSLGLVHFLNEVRFRWWL